MATALKNDCFLREKGLVFNIERYAVHDGPGIRTIVFLSGCPLQCLWCANPEGQQLKQQLSFFPDKCTGCKECILICPHKAIEQKNNKIIMNWNKCKHCLKCVEVCSNEARKSVNKIMNSEQVLKELMKDLPFYHRSNGGVTLSGGEPLMQCGFSANILKLCKKEGINTAIETSGYSNWDNFVEILKYTDFIFYDIKHMDTKEHKYGTGVGNEKILENLAKISILYKDIDIVVRIPLIPNFNDTEKNIYSTAKYVKTLKNISKMELLPYHKLGVMKYEYIGKPYLLKELDSPKIEVLNRFKNIIQSNDIKCEIL